MEREYSISEAQRIVRGFIEALRDETQQGVAGERPDDDGRYSAARGEEKVIVDALNEALRVALLSSPAGEVEGQFGGAPKAAALNTFLAELGGELSFLPPQVFGMISAQVESKFEVTLKQPTEEQRRFEVNVRYLLQASNLSEPEIRRLLAERINQYKAEHGGKINKAVEDGIVEGLVDKEKLREMCKAS